MFQKNINFVKHFRLLLIFFFKKMYDFYDLHDAMHVYVNLSFFKIYEFNFNRKNWLIFVDNLQIIKTLIVICYQNNAIKLSYLSFDCLQNFKLEIEFYFELELFFFWWFVFCHDVCRNQFEWSRMIKKDNFDDCHNAIN